MPDRRRIALMVGVFLVGSMLVASLVLLTLGQRAGFLARRYTLVTYFENVQGLVPGAPVWLVGKDVGSVQHVTFAPLSGEVPPVRVVLQIDASVQDRIRSDSVASIGTIGLLGDRYIALSMGTPEGRVLQGDEELASMSPVDFEVAIMRGTQAIDNVADLADNVNLVVQDFRTAMGGQKLAEASESVVEISESLASMLDEVRGGGGLLHSLIYDSYEGGGVESIERSLARLEEIVAEVATGDGLLHQLIFESPDGDAFGEALAALASLNDILTKVDAGQGTLGLLVNDPTLYHDMKVLLGGAQRSLVVRSLVRLSTDGASQ